MLRLISNARLLLNFAHAILLVTCANFLSRHTDARRNHATDLTIHAFGVMLLCPMQVGGLELSASRLVDTDNQPASNS